MKRRKSIIVETAGVFGARAVFFVVGLISSIIINRTLGAEGRGVFAILLLYPDLLFMLFSFGMGEASAFNIGKKVFSDERVFAGIITASLVAGAVVLLFGAGLYELLRVAQFKGIGFGMFMFSLARMPLYFFFRFMDYFFIGRTEIGRRNALIVVQITSYLVFIVLFLLTGRLNVFGAVATVNLSYLVVCLYALFSAAKSVRPAFAGVAGVLAESVKFGLKQQLASILIWAVTFGNYFMIKYYLDSEAVGLFAVASAVISMVWMFPEAVGLIAFARSSVQSEKESNASIPKMLRSALFLCLGAIVGAGLVCPLLVPLIYGADFKPSVRLIFFMLPSSLGYLCFNMLLNDLRARGIPLLAVPVLLIAIAFNFSFNILFLKSMGNIAAAANSSLTFILLAAGILITYKRHSQVSYGELLILRKADVAAIVDFAKRKLIKRD